MELLQLRYFQIIAHTQNISAAAEKLHIAQPALSQTLKRLEQEVGTPLFDRVGRHIRLNAYGEIFLKYVESAFSSLDNASLEIQTIKGLDAKTVKLSILAASMLLPDLYCRIMAEDPSVRLQILQNTRKHLPAKNELILSSDWEYPQDVSACSLLMEEEIQLALPSGHPLLTKTDIFLSDLSRETFISLSPESSLALVLSHYFNLHHYEPTVTACIDNPDIMRKLLTAHAGLAFIPTRTWQGFASGEVVLRTVKDLPMKRLLFLSWNPDAFLTPSVLLCRRIILDYFTKYNSPNQLLQA